MKEIKKTVTIPLHLMVTHKSNTLKRIGKFKSKEMMEMAMQEAVIKQHFSTENFKSPFISWMKQACNYCLTTKQK